MASRRLFISLSLPSPPAQPIWAKIEDYGLIMIDSRRKFIGTMATGLATTLASPKGVLGANDRIRMGIIGAGARGVELVHWALACPNLDFVAFADIYTKRLEDAKELVPSAAT